jgi:AAA+ ATPase superfamily predicted ATPase
MVGRYSERESLNIIIKKKKSAFLAVTGRRRVGKTYLIDKHFERNMCFRFTGVQDASFVEQINNFTIKLSEYSKTPLISSPKTWQEALFILKNYLKTLDKKKKQVIFIDELPWISTTKSGFLKMLAHLWNDYLSKEKHFILVVCGSASSWLTKHIINDIGGLHNRLTDLIHLQPFSLAETKEFLNSLSVKLNNDEIAKLYMTFGGVPYYLEQIRRGESVAVAIDRICFSNSGVLKNEFDNLYKALFKNANNHESIVKVLAQKLSGLSRKEIIEKSKIKSGGNYNRTIDELVQSGFVSEFIPFGRKKRGVMYRLNDEFSIFYHKFMRTNQKYSNGMWLQLSASQSYKIWLGFAFENLCLKHINEIKKELGISGVYSEVSSYRVVGDKTEKGFHIDLLIDRKDDVINLCEMKYYGSSYKIDKKYAKELQDKRQRFIENS